MRLTTAHGRGVVHRDLKPSNIMLTPRGIKLLDFGLASLARDRAARRRRNAGGFMGTFRYMSPEQARGEPLDRRTDLFSLGIVLYEAATGRLRSTVTRRTRCGRRPSRPSPCRRRASPPISPAAFDRVMARALTKDRDERYSAATELGADLARLECAAAAQLDGWGIAAARCGGRATACCIMAGLTGARSAAPAREKQTIVVGGFTNTTGDPAVRRFAAPRADGAAAADAVHQRLSRHRRARDTALDGALADDPLTPRGREGDRRAPRNSHVGCRFDRAAGRRATGRAVCHHADGRRQPERRDARARARGGEEQERRCCPRWAARLSNCAVRSANRRRRCGSSARRSSGRPRCRWTR